MPIVCLGRIGWFPLELAYQSFAKTRDANEPSMVQAVLRYYDAVAGTNLQNDMAQKQELMSNLTGSDGVAFAQMLAAYNLKIDSRPLTLKARVLVPPRIEFDNSRAQIRNGSWDLRNIKLAV